MQSLRDRQIVSMAAALRAAMMCEPYYKALALIEALDDVLLMAPSIIPLRPLAAAILSHTQRLPAQGAASPGPVASIPTNPDFLPLCRLLGPVLEAAAKGAGLSAMECAALAEQVMTDLRGGAAGGVA